MVTPAPSSWVGRLGPTKSAAVQMRVVPARLAPLMVTHEPCENPGRKLPPLSTSVMRGVATGVVCAAGGAPQGGAAEPLAPEPLAPARAIKGRPLFRTMEAANRASGPLPSY